MNQDEIIEMARPFLWGGNVVEGWTFSSYEQLETFAKLVAEKEREECAEVCEEYAIGLERNYSEIIADKIRARGQA